MSILFAKRYGFIGEITFAIPFGLFYIYNKENINGNYAITIFIVGILFNTLLKKIFKTKRPCYGLKHCPKTYDFPSGHSAVAIYYSYCLLIQKTKFDTIMGIYYLTIPFSTATDG